MSKNSQAVEQKRLEISRLGYEPSRGIIPTRVRIIYDLIAASICDKYSVGPSIRPTCTRCCFTMTNIIQACSNFR